jgi:predicted nucleotidyltransferase
MQNEIQKYSQQIEALCILHNVKTLFAFGSVLSDKFNSNSDIDMIVDIADNDPFTYTDNYFDLKFKLENLFNRPVDLLENKALKNPYLKKEIDTTKVLVYGK